MLVASHSASQLSWSKSESKIYEEQKEIPEAKCRCDNLRDTD